MDILRKRGNNVLRLVINVSPVYSMICILLTIIKALMLTLVTTLTTAKFVDIATDILRGEKGDSYIWKPLVLLLLNLLFVNVINSIISLLRNKISLCIEREYKPLLLKKQASIDFQHIENNESWLLISRVTTNPQDYLLNGFNAFMTMLTTIIYISSVLGMIFIHASWAAILIFIFSVPMLKFSITSGRKSYQATCETEKFRRHTKYFEDVLTNSNNIEERTMFRYGKKVSDDWWKIHEKGRKILSCKTYYIFNDYAIQDNAYTYYNIFICCFI